MKLERTLEKVPVSFNVNDEIRVTRGPEDKGWELHVKITVSDGGMISVDDRPLNQGPPYDPSHGWTGVAAFLGVKVTKFREYVAKQRRHAERAERSA